MANTERHGCRGWARHLLVATLARRCHGADNEVQDNTYRMHTSPSRCCQGLICYGLHIDTVFCAHLSTGRAELSASLPEDASAYWVPAAQGHRHASTSDDPFADGDADGAEDVSAGVGSVPINAFHIGAH